MAAEEDLFGPHLFDLGGRPGLAGRIGEVGAVIGQHGVDRVGNGGGSARRKSPATRRVAFSCSRRRRRSEEHTSELQSLMRISYAVFCLKKKKQLTLNKCTYLL